MSSHHRKGKRPAKSSNPVDWNRINLEIPGTESFTLRQQLNLSKLIIGCGSLCLSPVIAIDGQTTEWMINNTNTLVRN